MTVYFVCKKLNSCFLRFFNLEKKNNKIMFLELFLACNKSNSCFQTQRVIVQKFVTTRLTSIPAEFASVSTKAAPELALEAQ